MADAGPLIHLAEIGALDLLKLFRKILIPQAVWDEVVGQNRVAPADLSELGNIDRLSVAPDAVMGFVTEYRLESLHPGECESLYVCRQKITPLILTDDLAVRRAAKQLAFTPVGSLGVVVKACKLGRISLVEARKNLLDLQDVSSLFVTRAIVELAVESLSTQ